MRPVILMLLGTLFLVEDSRAQTEAPFVFEFAYTGDVVANVAGGRHGGLVYLDMFDAVLRFDLEQGLGLPRTEAYLHGLGTQGGHPTRLVGDLQGVNNIEAPNSWKLYEALVQYVRAAGHMSVLAGLYDLNTEFDVIHTAALFINSSHGIGPDFSQSGRNGPSIFPFTSLGIRVKWLPTDAWYVQAVALDGVPGDPDRPGGVHVILRASEGALLAAETGWYFAGEAIGERGAILRGRVSRFAAADFDGRLAMGAWMYTEPFERVDRPGQRAKSRGAYVLGEWRPTVGEGWLSRVSLFGRFGLASSSVNRLGRYVGAGVVFNGPVTGREADQVGLAVASAHNGNPFRQVRIRQGQPVSRAETTFELTYLATLSDRVAVQGDVQYVIDPDTDPTLPDALVLGLRLSVTF